VDPAQQRFPARPTDQRQCDGDEHARHVLRLAAPRRSMGQWGRSLVSGDRTRASSMRLIERDWRHEWNKNRLQTSNQIRPLQRNNAIIASLSPSPLLMMRAVSHPAVTNVGVRVLIWHLHCCTAVLCCAALRCPNSFHLPPRHVKTHGITSARALTLHTRDTLTVPLLSPPPFC
jgi:hypothetical protein